MRLHDTLQLSRRTLLRQLGATGVLITFGPAGVWATQEMVQQAIRARIGTREPQPGGMTLRLPKIAETGNSVPLTVTVESPMTAEDHVLRLHVFVEGNPEPVAATYHFGVRAGKAEMSTRIRLARSQTVLALAEMSDGSVRSGSASILVTLGACIEEVWGD
jgi:sulfur-oxidizing protein SoxY